MDFFNLQRLGHTVNIKIWNNLEEYRNYFKDMFSETVLEPCYNSIPPRLGSELFIHLKK